MGIQQSLNKQHNSDQTTKNGFGENSSFQLNKLRHQELKVFYAKESQVRNQAKQKQNRKSSHQSNKDLKVCSHDSGPLVYSPSDGNDQIEEDPQHHDVENYLFLTDSANQVVYKDKRRVKYIFEELKSPVVEK